MPICQFKLVRSDGTADIRLRIADGTKLRKGPELLVGSKAATVEVWQVSPHETDHIPKSL